MTTDWLPTSPAQLERLRAALPSVLDGWLEIDVVLHVRLDVPRQTAGSTSAWLRMPSVLREAAGAVARFSQAKWTGSSARGVDLRLLAHNAALLEAHLGDPQRPFSESEFQRHAVEILAPLLAQAVCLREGDDGS